jgi:hypothetical protein
MAQGVTRSELRKVRSIVSLIGEENLQSLSRTEYFSVRGLHIYSVRTEDNQLFLSIWDKPKDSPSSQCLFADRISMPAFNAALEYWRPRYPPSSSLGELQ